MALKRLVGYAARHKTPLLLGLAASAASTLASVMVPQAARLVVDALLRKNMGELEVYVAAIVGLMVASGVFWYIQRVEARKLAELVAADLRVELYAKMQELPLSFIYRKGAGQLMSRATADLEEVKRLFLFFMMAFISSLFTLAFSLASMVSIDAYVASMSYLALIPLPFIFRSFAKRIRLKYREAREVYGQLTSFLRETIVGILAVKALAAEERLTRRFARSLDAYWGEMYRIGLLRALVWASFVILGGLSFATIYFLGGQRVMSGELTVGDVVALGLYSSMLTWPMASLGLAVTRVELSRVAASRVFEILDAKEEVEEAEDAEPLTVREGRVEFEDVWFSYDGERWVLRGLDLEIEPGEIVAITGPPGSGKSSLAMLLLRLYDPQRGKILIDGVDIKRVKLSSLRGQVGLVHQDIYLFPGTIGENIAYAKPNATREEIERAARLANIHGFISELPQGYDTPVGEGGVTLSGGQRQRVAIARTLLADPKIIVFDDSTSEVDAETEKAIYDALTRHFKGRTIIVITQRPSTMRLADRVVVLRGGRVAYQGKPEEVIRRLMGGGVEAEESD